MLRRTRMPARRSRLRAASKKRMALGVQLAAFRLGILARDGYACRYCGTKRGPLDVHHVLKPRARYLMDPLACVTLCRRHHDMTTAAYRQGRLMITGAAGVLVQFEVVYAKDKFAAHSGLLLPQWD